MAQFSDHKAAEQLEQESGKVDEHDVENLLLRQKAIEEKVRGNGALKRFGEDVRLMFSLLGDYWNGSYREIPWKSIAAMAGALIYVLNPLDLIPDMIVGLGLVDDASVVALCLRFVEADLIRYAVWKEQREESWTSQP